MQKIILRLDLNVPLSQKGDRLLETSKIDTVLPEIKKLLLKNKVTILSHLGQGKKTQTLAPIEKYLREQLTQKENGNLTVLENVRFLKGETAKINTKEWRKTTQYLASLGDVYIDDAFPVMHRAEASIVGLPKFLKKEGKKVALGEYSKKEIHYLTQTLNLAKNKKVKTLLILSGIKIETKLPLIKKFLALGAKVFLSGGNANQVLKEVLNYSLGQSYYDKSFHLTAKLKNYLAKEIKKGNLLLPSDVILKDGRVELITKLKKQDFIADIGPTTLAILKQNILLSENIILNGPLGIYEENFVSGTLAIFKFLKENSKKKNILIGGGDTLVLVKKANLKEETHFHISLAGGAMLEFLTQDGKLPGILALQ